MSMTEITLPFELTNGNDGRGYAWYKSASARKKFERQLRMLGHVRTPFDVPVKVTVTRILGKRQREWDASSGLRGNWKEIEDALVACGWFHDDKPQWIVATDFRQDASQRTNGPAVKVTIEPMKEETK